MHEQNRKVLEIIRALGYKYHSEFATRMQVSEADLSRYVTGRRVPSKSFVEKLFVVFNVSPEWFYRSEGSMFVVKEESDYNSENIQWLRDELFRAKDDVIRVTEELVIAKEENNQLLKQMVDLINK